MPKFIAIHTVPPKSMTLQQVREISYAAQQDKAVKGRQSFGNLAEGKLVCILEAPTKNDLATFFKNKGVPVESITQVEFEGDGATIRPA